MRRKILQFSAVFILSVFIPASFAQDKRSDVVNVDFLDQNKSEILYKNSYALIIGISDYTDGWNDLPGVGIDVPEVQEALKKHNFQTTVLMNPKSKEMLDGVKQFLDDYGYEFENRLLIYFAGHGHTQKLADGRELGYIIPADVPLQLKDGLGFQRKAISMDTIQYLAKQAQSKHVLFMFDSCFSGKLISRDATKIPLFIRENVANPVRQFITSGTANQTVPDESYFRRVFVQALDGAADRNNDSYILGSELADYLRESVITYSEGTQTPQYGKIRDIDLDKGDFVFVLPKIIKSQTTKIVKESRLNVSIDFWEKQRAIALKPREDDTKEQNDKTSDDDTAEDDDETAEFELTGARPTGLSVPTELFGDSVIKQKKKILELTLKLPNDFADLADMYFQGKLIDLPIATDTYFLDIQSLITGKSFTSFDFVQGSVKLVENSEKYKILENLANNFSGEKYDLQKQSDRKEMRIHLLQMLNPVAKSVLEQIATSYKKRFNRPLRVTSMVRSMEYQIEMNLFDTNSFMVRGAGALPPHTTGFTFDLARTHMTAKEQNFVMQELAELERKGKVDALIEYGMTPCFHIFVYPDGKPPKM